jgi:HD-GYP domain-containing protein (c-di-GMP phosphodiesterase class II)
MATKKELIIELKKLLKFDCDRDCAFKRFKEVLEFSDIGIYITSIYGHLLYTNNYMASLFGFDTPNDLANSNFDIRDIYSDKTLRDKILEKLQKDGYCEVEASLLNIKDNKKIKAKYFVLLKNELLYGILLDVTKEKEYSSALNKAIEALEQTQINLNKSNRFGKGVLIAVVETLSRIGEMKDPYTFGHQLKVSQLSVEIGKRFNLPEEELECLEISGILHDIGKFYTPTEILVRPGKLTNHELEFIRLHPEVGSKIVENIPFQYKTKVHEVILQHHERMDGSGYPYGVKGQDINFLSRIISVADIVEAVSNHRPYRPSLGIEEAVKIIYNERNTTLDDDIVDVCIQVLLDGFKFKKIIDYQVVK